MTPPTYMQGIAIFMMGVFLKIRQRPLVFAFFLVIVILGIANGVSLVLLIPFGLTILYANGLIRNIKAITLDAGQKVKRRFDDLTLAVLIAVVSILLVATGITIGYLGNLTASIVFDLTLLGAMVAGSAFFMAYFLSRRMKGRASAAVYFFPFVMQLLIPSILANYNRTQYFVISFLPITLAFLLIPIVMIWYFKKMLRAGDSVSKSTLIQEYGDKVNSPSLQLNREQFYAQLAGKKSADCTLQRIECLLREKVFHVGLIRRGATMIAIGIRKESSQALTEEERNLVLRIVAFTEIAKSTPKVKFSMRRLFASAAAGPALSALDDSVEAWKQSVGQETSDEMRTKLDITGIETRLLISEETKEAQRLLTAFSAGSECPWEVVMTLATDSLTGLISILEREVEPWTKRAVDYRQAYENHASLKVGERMMGFKGKSSAEVRLEQVKSKLDSIRLLKKLFEKELENDVALMMKLPSPT